jgi:hypothetical protein
MSQSSSETSSVSPSDLDKIKRGVQNYRLRGQYNAGHVYICGLPQSTRQVKTVAIEIAQLYLVQGHYIRASEACALAHKPTVSNDAELKESSPGAFDADHICLELLSAYIDISRRCKLKTALHISQRVYDAWLAPMRRYIEMK